MTVVTKEDIKFALKNLGIVTGDIVLIHSSMKSMGHVEGGPETVIQAVFQEGPTVVPVPIIDKGVDTVGQRLLDLKFHDLGISFVLITPQRFPGENLTGHPGFGSLNSLPFTHAFFPENPGPGFIAGVGGPDVGGNIVF